MIYPKFLKQGDLISVVAPSDGAYNQLKAKRFLNAKNKLENLGYKVEFSESVLKSEMARSADAKTRGKEFNDAINNSDSKLILCATGGEFIVEMLEYVGFEKLANNPKWVEGMSDPTGILFPLTTKYDIASIYGHNLSSFGMQDYHKSLLENLEIFKGNLVEQNSFELFENKRGEEKTGLEGYNLTDKVEWKILNKDSAKFEGRIIGGCLDLIIGLSGTKYDGMKEFNEKYKEDGIIFYFDNCELSKEDLIRALWRLNELEYFKYTKGIIFGRNGNENSCLGYTMERALKDSILSNLNIPIIYDADISHKPPCLTIINGAIAKMEVENGSAKVSFELK